LFSVVNPNYVQVHRQLHVVIASKLHWKMFNNFSSNASQFVEVANADVICVVNV